MDEFIVITSTFPTKKEAERISNIILKKRLAACSQVSGPITSFYWWEGRLETNEEYFVHIKTLNKFYDEVESEIKKNHPYKIPEITGTSIKCGNKEYLNWIREETSLDKMK